MSKIIGIDLGTTNSCVSVMEGGKPTVIINTEGDRTTPSVVGFSKKGERLVGSLAKRQAVSDPERTVMSIKRYMGTDHRVKINDKEYSPEEISAMILQKLKADAEAYLGQDVTKAVITVPAYFNDSQRQATKNAGTIAGLEVMRIINEPTAAALAYGLDKNTQEAMTVAVFDLGGGTFDVSILEVEDGVFEVKSTAGDTDLGGDDWDHRIVEYLAKEFKDEHGVNLLEDKMTAQRLRDAAEKAKIELSQKFETNVNIPFITMIDGEQKHLDVDLKRSKFEELTSDLLERCKKPCERAMKDAKLSKSDIDRVLLVGGSTRMPMITELVNAYFDKEPSKDINPDECVALGAAIQGGVLAGDVKDIVLVDVTPLTLGVEAYGGVMSKLIERNTSIPVSKSQVYTTAADMQTNVEVHVLQGEREMASDNRSLGRFFLSDIPAAPRGVPQIEVKFEIDSNGILNVSAKDKGTGKEQTITITASTNLSDNDVEKMVEEAKANAESDKKKRELVEAKNQGESLIYTLEKTLKEHEDKVPADIKEKVEAGKKSMREVLDKEDVTAEEINRELESLNTVLGEMGSSFYGDQNAESAAQENTEDATEDENVVDAEYEVKN